jgi:hypothetical protein
MNRLLRWGRNQARLLRDMGWSARRMWERRMCHRAQRRAAKSMIMAAERESTLREVQPIMCATCDVQQDEPCPDQCSGWR